ncbi:MAG TPA: leucine--tRNA ligase, partial [Chloroflexota bacterium]|nr:leucine--tRNA ligase [Chloroflexota bacterium]
EWYDAATVELKWQDQWDADELYRATEESPRPKWYALDMFPYTSGDIHIGHWYHYAVSDAHARYKRMRGFNVMKPFGFDAFGLPAENAAIKGGIRPAIYTIRNIQRMRSQFRAMGVGYDWNREIATCLPSYYMWTQWLFLQLYKGGLAYKAIAAANWCPSCNTVLANEQVIDGRCERCDTEVTKKNLDQWFFRITRYAEELLSYDGIDWPERIRVMQTNWIGKSVGVEIVFKPEKTGADLPVFTTRPDTIYGVTFLLLAPEHALVAELTTPDRLIAVEEYVEATKRVSEIDRQAVGREKTGVFTGAYAINPLNGERVPIWIADYVLQTYGTGAVMGVPAHDQRDFEFATFFGLPIQVVVEPPGWTGTPLAAAYVGDGRLINSGQFNGQPSNEGIETIANFVEVSGSGERKVQYRLRDWLISRQRYWGPPIPIIYCPVHGEQPVPDDELPVRLPIDVEFLPTGESPLRLSKTFLDTTCPKCGGPATRESDTLDTFVDSSWYFLRYCSPHVSASAFDPKLTDFWMPVDLYIGGPEHATMHLLYARFFVKALRDLGLVPYGEPFKRLFNQGLVISGGRRMSKSRGNVINPDDFLGKLGADTVRAYLMFLGPWDQGGDWSDKSIQGVYRFLNRVWSLVLDTQGAEAPEGTNQDAEREIRRLTHQTIRRVTDDIDKFRFNTAVAALMEFSNGLGKYLLGSGVGTPAWRDAIRSFMLLLAPIAPFMAEELWSRLGQPYSIHHQSWPEWSAVIAADEQAIIVVQVNGRVRDKLIFPVGVSQSEVESRARASERVERFIDGKPITHVVYVPDKLLSIVTR